MLKPNDAAMITMNDAQHATRQNLLPRRRIA
jgi:hypothetical protein